MHEAMQKQPSRGVLRKRCSENMQEIYSRIPIKFAGYFQNTYGRLLLAMGR